MLGAQAEMLVRFAQPGEGFAVVARDVNTAGDSGWVVSDGEAVAGCPPGYGLWRS